MRLINDQRKFIFAFFTLIVITALIFWKFFVKGLFPFPGDFLLAWYEPWKSQFFSNGVITLAHKPIADDVFRQLYPFKILASDMVRNLSLPLWNPYNGAGMPLMATMHAGFLTPFNLFFVFLPHFLAWSLYIMVQPLLLGIFFFLYCRKVRLSFGASLFATTTLIFSGFVITRLIFGEYIYTFSMLPLVLYLVESSMQNPKSQTILLLPLAILFMFISGQPQIIFYALVFSLAYLFFRYQQVKKEYSSRNLLMLFLLFVIGVGLSAIQLLPTLELFSQSNISASSSQFIFQRFLLPIQHLLTILIPNYFGNQATYNYWGAGDYIETASSIGLIPCFFALLGIKRISKEQIGLQKFFLGATIVSVILALDWLGTHLLFSLPIPIVSTSVPSRIFALTTFSITILAGFGFDRWLSGKDAKRIANWIILFIFATAVLLAGTFFFSKMHVSCNNEFIIDCRSVALRNTLLEIVGFSIFTTLFLLYIRYKKNIIHRLIPFLVLSLTIFLGLYNSNKFLPFSKKETFLPQNNLIKALQNQTVDERVLGMGGASIKTDFATYFRFLDPNFYDPLYNKRYGELISFANTGNLSFGLLRSDVEISSELAPKSSNLLQKRRELFNLLSVKYLVFKKDELKDYAKNSIVWEDKNWIILKNNYSLPHIYLVGNYEAIRDKQQLLKRLFDFSFNPRTTVLLETEPSVDKQDLNSSNGKVEQISYGPNSIVLKTITSKNELLVLTDNYYPGWKAYINGKQVPIYRANYSFRSIVIPSGNHLISFSYEPFSVKLGGFISGLSLILYLLLIFSRKKLLNIQNAKNN